VQDLARSTAFLVVSFIVPGIIELTALLLLVPEWAIAVSLINQLAGQVAILGPLLTIALFAGHVGHLVEDVVLDPVWRVIHPGYGQRERILNERAKIITEADANKVSHEYYDQTMAQFILHTNSCVFLAILSSVTLVRHILGHQFDSYVVSLAVVILPLSLIVLLWGAPRFKDWSIDALEGIQSANRTARAGLDS
jgi:hypothetical protein